MIWIKPPLILIALLFVSACGYHLRNTIDLPEGLKNVYVKGASGQLKNAFKKTLKLRGARLVGNLEEAGLVVRVTDERMRRSVLSVSSTGRANEYELYYVLDFILLDKEGNKLSETQSIEIIRDYFNDQEDILGKDNEERIIRDEMYHQAIQTIFNRSRFALEKVKK